VAVTAEALAADDDQLTSSMELSESDRFVAAVPWSHSYGLSSLVLPHCVAAACWCCPTTAARGRRSTPPAPCRDGPPYGPDLLADDRIARRAANWPSTLRLVVSAGAPLRADTAARFLETFGRRAHVFYGASECGGISYDREGTAALRGTVGTPVDGVTIRLPDPAAGGEGTVSIRSAAVGLGYVPSETTVCAEASSRARISPRGRIAAS
jgi:acyl-coenzyme A synthetase/AMP-(fatty) acid ligase